MRSVSSREYHLKECREEGQTWLVLLVKIYPVASFSPPQDRAREPVPACRTGVGVKGHGREGG